MISFHHINLYQTRNIVIYPLIPVSLFVAYIIMPRCHLTLVCEEFYRFLFLAQVQQESV